MADLLLSQQKVWLHGYDVSGDIKGLVLGNSKEALDNTVLGMTTRSRKGGLEDITFDMNGFWEAGPSPAQIDDILFTRIGVADVPVSIGVVAGAEGEVAYTFRCIKGEYAPADGGEVGTLVEFNVSAQASGGEPLVRGLVLLNQAALTTTGAGTKFQLGAVAAGQRVYAALHVLGAGTGTFDAILQSDADSSGGGETNRITFTQANGITSEWRSLVGPITDTWWRLSYTIAGGAPSFNVRLVVGIK